MTTASTNSDQNHTQQEQLSNSNIDSAFTGQHGVCGGARGGRGRGGRSNVQCQVCHKIGHDASICYHRFKRDYVPGGNPSASAGSGFPS